VIVKVQRPIAGDMDNLLVYDEAKELLHFIPCDSEVGKELLRVMGSDLRVYLRATPTLDGDYQFDYRRIGEAQDW
jgi:hypothetical protein